MKVAAFAFLTLLALPQGYWPLDRSTVIIEKTQRIRLNPDLSVLSDAERTAILKLLGAGRIIQKLYESQLHAQALSSYVELSKLHATSPQPETQNLLTLYRLFQGPIATTLDNKREAFLPVDAVVPGKNVYPWGVKAEEIEAFLKVNREQRSAFLDLRTVVRRTTPENLSADLERLNKYPGLALFHPNLRSQLSSLAGNVTRTTRSYFYVIPYSLAYADELIKIFHLLNEAADALQQRDPEFAGYLQNRARDLLSNDYESGDASWVTGDFKSLNAEIGSYETYDDELFGVKTFFALSLLLKREKETAALREALKGLQDLENSLPYQHHKKVKEDIPVGVYDVIADFGQARGGNTATILPNDNELARKYGRVILLRSNIMRNPDLVDRSVRTFAAAVGEKTAGELTSDGNFYRTLWHEIGHYLGVDRTNDGEPLDVALQEHSNTIEELKSDLVSLFVAQALHKQGYYTDTLLRSIYASGILRVLQNNRPRPDQPYNRMQLMQWNYFLENGLLTFDGKELRIHYDEYHEVVKKMLAKTLAVQRNGEKKEAAQFIEQYTKWNDSHHEIIASRIRAQQKYRFSLFRYAALGE